MVSLLGSAVFPSGSTLFPSGSTLFPSGSTVFSLDVAGLVGRLSALVLHTSLLSSASLRYSAYMYVCAKNRVVYKEFPLPLFFLFSYSPFSHPSYFSHSPFLLPSPSSLLLSSLAPPPPSKHTILPRIWVKSGLSSGSCCVQSRIIS